MPGSWTAPARRRAIRTVVERATDRGSLMLLGGQEAGHKGFGLALMVEALTQGLAGFGRKDAPARWGASVYIQFIDPDAFAGRDAFLDQVELSSRISAGTILRSIRSGRCACPASRRRALSNSAGARAYL